jgi:hypothetical protein
MSDDQIVAEAFARLDAAEAASRERVRVLKRQLRWHWLKMWLGVARSLVVMFAGLALVIWGPSTVEILRWFAP